MRVLGIDVIRDPVLAMEGEEIWSPVTLNCGSEGHFAGRDEEKSSLRL